MTNKQAYRVIVLILAALAFLVCLPQIPGCVAVSLPRHGRVVDKMSGKPMQNVAVVATDEYVVCGGFPEYRCGSDHEYRVVTNTDEDGNYSIPGQFGSLASDRKVPWWLVLSSTNTKILISAFKPGYILSEDARTDKAHFPTSSVTDRGGFSRTVDLQMEPAAADREDLAVYYARIARLGTSEIFSEDETEGADVLIRQPGRSFLLKSVCSLPAEIIVHWPELSSIIAFFDTAPKYSRQTNSFSRSDFRRSLFSLEPDGFLKHSQTLEYDSKYSGFQARNVCEAMKSLHDKR